MMETEVTAAQSETAAQTAEAGQPAAGQPAAAAPETGGNVREGQGPDTQRPALFQEGPAGDAPRTGQEEPGPEAVAAADLKVPEGFTYDPAAGDAFLSVVNDGALSRKEMAQKLADLHAVQMRRMMEALAAADAEGVKAFEADMAKEKAEWMRQCQADPEYGGQNWDASQAAIDRGCRLVATPEAVALLQRYNLNTHPEIVRMFWRAGKLAGEDGLGGGSGNGGGNMDPAEAIFGESLRNWKQRGAADYGK